ncbi:MAG: acetyl-CoA carboxylase biotin carboxyl carrier protein [Bacteroidia bacterium]
MELKQIQDLIKFVAKSGVEEVELEKGNFKINIKAKSKETENSPQVIYAQPGLMPSAQAAVPAPAAAPAPTADNTATPAATSQPAAPETNGVEIKAPMIGTFYRSPGPDKDAFVKVGDRVEKGQVVCIIEAMKLFNEIESDASGTIVKVLVDDTTPVEYDQPLFIVE